MKVFDRCRIGSMELRNRLVMAPMSCNLGVDGFVTDRMVTFFEERAKGGVGLITIGDGIVDAPIGNNVRESTAIDDDKYVPDLKKLTDAVKAHGAKIALQLSHGGRRAGRVSKEGYLDVTRGRIPVAPSPIPHPVPGQVVPRALTREEIREIVEKFGLAARRTIEAGFDAVGLHCAHMYLCGQFLSPWANQRTDEYGRDFDGRMRFVLEVIDRVKRETGGEYPLIVRMNGEEPQGGNTLAEIQEIARRMEKAGVDAIHVSVGFGASTKTPGLIPSVSPMRAPAGCIVYLAENIKKAVSIPVIAVSKLGDLRVAERVLQEGRADMIGLGRPLIADPYLPTKGTEGRLDEIRPCIYCCEGCLKNVLEKDAPVACSINPAAGRELEVPVAPAEKPKTVLVVGGGPGGMQAAITAATRGHKVTLVEKAQELGGDLILASKPPGKKDIDPFRDYLVDQLHRTGVEVRLGQEVRTEWLDAVRPDCAIIATGGRPIDLKIPGLFERTAFGPIDVLTGAEIPGRRTVVIGGGAVGCEVAEFLCQQGKEVTLIEILDDVARDMDRINRLPLIMSLEGYGVRIMTKTRVVSVTDDGVRVDCLGKQETILADDVVMAVGKSAEVGELDDWARKNLPEVYVIGDKRKPGGILEAVRDGFEVARKI
jgi:2,4-dienoyl-CoA reductase (NADPH2)